MFPLAFRKSRLTVDFITASSHTHCPPLCHLTNRARVVSLRLAHPATAAAHSGPVRHRAPCLHRAAAAPNVLICGGPASEGGAKRAPTAGKRRCGAACGVRGSISHQRRALDGAEMRPAPGIGRDRPRRWGELWGEPELGARRRGGLDSGGPLVVGVRGAAAL